MWTIGVKSGTGITVFLVAADQPNASAVPGYLAFYLASTGALVALIPNEMLAYATVTPPGAAGSVA